MNGKSKRIVIQFACTAKEKRAYRRDAKRLKLTLSQWMRAAGKTTLALGYEDSQGLTR